MTSWTTSSHQAFADPAERADDLPRPAGGVVDQGVSGVPPVQPARNEYEAIGHELSRLVERPAVDPRLLVFDRASGVNRFPQSLATRAAPR
jgi:hypothetical protein